MSRKCVCLLILAFLISPAAAQQGNGPTASLSWNNQSSGPYPITGVQLVGGAPVSIAVATGAGNPFAPFVLAQASTLLPAGIPVLGNSLLDLDPATLQIIWDPGLNPAINTGPTGVFTLFGTMPNLPGGITIPFQAAVFDPTAPQLARLTAATEVLTVQGSVVINHTIVGDGYATVNLNSYGFTLPFYGVEYSTYYVSGNGFISFTPPSTDFTSSEAEMTSGAAKICLLWCDLAPSNGGQIFSTIDLNTQVVPTVKVDFVAIQDFGTGGPSHTMAWEHFASPVGNLSIIQDVTQQASNFTMMTGISAGSGGSSGTSLDLTNVQDTFGQSFGPGIPIFEWFGFAGQAYYSGATNTFDLYGRTFLFLPQFLSPGSPNSVAGDGGYFLL